jgi:hypothetical protein
MVTNDETVAAADAPIDRYAPNVRDWGLGDLVIHLCDYKGPNMLMVVIGADGDLLKKVYANRPPSKSAKVYTNEKAHLLDPARFGIKIPAPNDGAYRSSPRAGHEGRG